MSNMNRRAILAGAATLPAISIPALGSEPDPAFAAIEAYKTAFDAFIARCRYEDDLGRVKLEPAPDDFRTPEMVALVNSSIATRQALAATVPTTMAGLVAVLKCVIEESVDQFLFEDEEEEVLIFLNSIKRAVIRLAR
jgi:hypothetical protein